jgi:hypothetical protein
MSEHDTREFQPFMAIDPVLNKEVTQIYKTPTAKHPRVPSDAHFKSKDSLARS